MNNFANWAWWPWFYVDKRSRRFATICGRHLQEWSFRHSSTLRWGRRKESDSNTGRESLNQFISIINVRIWFIGCFQWRHFILCFTCDTNRYLVVPADCSFHVHMEVEKCEKYYPTNIRINMVSGSSLLLFVATGILDQTPIPRHSSLNVRDHISQPYCKKQCE